MSEVAVLQTDQGPIVLEFWEDVAPKTVENFKKLASDGFYDGTCFHRLIPGFMIQGGDPLTRDDSKQRYWGTGGPGHNVNAEFNDNRHQRGVISMARSSDPNSAGSQFFICFADASFLDGEYTCFGRMVDGEDTLAKLEQTPIEQSPSGERSKPVNRVNLESVKIVPRSEWENA
jgi:peptidyl-prolyl cis-trans isomerase B (cyclophilin B)